MNIKGIHLSWIISSDIKASKKFFTETLGLKLTEDNAEYGWMELQGKDDGSLLGVGKYCPEYSKDDKPGQNAVVTFTVDDLEASIKELTAQGVIFVDKVLEVPGQVKMITFLDPDKNKFQLVQELK